MKAQTKKIATGLLLGWVVVFILFSSKIAFRSYEVQNLNHVLESPNLKHWFGTDVLGRDLLSRVFYGAQISLFIGTLGTFLALMIGLFFGLVTGYCGGWVDRFLRRWIDLFATFPPLLVAMLLTLILGRDLLGILISMSMTSWTPFARLVRAQVFKIKKFPYIEGATAIGCSPLRILLFHILPNLINPLLLAMTFHIPNTIMLESFLSFIGLGLSPPLVSLGSLTREGLQTMHSYPHLTYIPSFTVFSAVFALNWLGNHLRNHFTRK